MYAQYGLTHHRLSIEWARIEPEEGKRDNAAIEHYLSVLTAARDAGVSPWVCLHHFTLPGWFTEMGEGGFVDDRARSYFWARHVAFCADVFGDLVFGWKPINEPGAFAAVYFQKARRFDVLGATLLAQRDAWRELRGGKPVATIHDLSPIFNGSFAANQMIWDVWLKAERDGVLALPGRPEREVPDLREACDLIGFSYYSALGFNDEGSIVPYPPGARVGPMGYAPWSEGLALVLRRLHEEVPGRPLLICEHGVGTARADVAEPWTAQRGSHVDDDEWRCDVLRESLSYVEDAINDGIDIRGFFHWTGVDNYEWNHGYDVQFGCFTRDREPRGSAELLREYATR